MTDRYCEVCEAESDLSHKCDTCGKPFHGDGDSSGEQSLRPDGGVEMGSNDGRPPRGRKRVLKAIRDLVAAGETDAMAGGVAPATIAEETGLPVGKAKQHCYALTDQGDLRKVDGIGPHGPRKSYLPVGDRSPASAADEDREIRTDGGQSVGGTEREYDHILTPDEMQDLLAHGVTVIDFDDSKLFLRDGFSNSPRSSDTVTDRDATGGDRDE